ncbi:MAG: baseplate J/gp47 family protein, partial [Ktedonobacteraceae bacterium]
PEPSTGAGRSTSPSSGQPSRYADEHFQIEDLGTGEALSSRPPVAGGSAQSYGPEYNFPISSASAIQPGSSSLEDAGNEVLPTGSFLPQDYAQARSIFQAAQEGAPAPEQSVRGARPDQPADASLAPMADDETAALPEQHGSVAPSSRHPGDSGVTNLPTEVYVGGEIEDLGDNDVFPPSSHPPYAAWSGEASEQDVPEQNMAAPPRLRGMRPRANQGGSVPSARSDIADRPTEDLPGSTPSRSPAKIPAAGASRAPEAHMLPLPGQAVSRVPSRSGVAAGSSRTPSRVPARRQQAGARRSGRRGTGALPIIISILILLVIIAVLAFFVPSAAVTVTLPAQAYQKQMTYTASAGSPLNIVTHTMPADTLSFPITVQGTGQATGSKPVGTVAATGTVTFTNKGTASVEIPTGTTITTSTGVAFVTTADALVLANNTNVDLVQAMQPGTNGNVPANAITVIPQSVLTQLRQANPNVTILLTVTNTAPTTGGGARNETTITANDVKTAESKLSRQVNSQVSAYLSKHTSPNDVKGTPELTLTPVASPAVGSVVNNGTFTLILHVQASVLIVHFTEIQAAASQEINAALKLAKRNYELIPQQSVKIVYAPHSPKYVGKTLSLSFTASGQIVPQVSIDQIRGIVSGKSLASARAALLSQHGGIAAIQDVTITVYPAFVGWVPFWQQHINVTFKTASPVSTPTPGLTPTPHAKK